MPIISLLVVDMAAKNATLQEYVEKGFVCWVGSFRLIIQKCYNKSFQLQVFHQNLITKIITVKLGYNDHGHYEH